MKDRTYISSDYFYDRALVSKLNSFLKPRCVEADSKGTSGWSPGITVFTEKG